MEITGPWNSLVKQGSCFQHSPPFPHMLEREGFIMSGPLLEYNRGAAVAYAVKWALSRNPAYANFDDMGGDCSNFCSQCIYAGSKVMNYTPVTGWYYNNLNNRAPAWTGVEYLFRFLTSSRGVGPHGLVVDQESVLPGDLIQLGDANGQFHHSLIVLTSDHGWITVATHTLDSLFRPLSTYTQESARFIRIVGVRKS